MAVWEGGVSGALADVGLAAASAAHTTNKPIAHGSLGHYRKSRRLAPAGTTLTGNLWCFRNPTASGIVVVVTGIRLKVVMVGAPTAAIEDRFNVKVARAYTVMDTTNGTDIAAAANMQEMRTTMGTSVVQIREASAAAGVSGGTKTVDTDSIAVGSTWVSAALASGLSNGPVTILEYEPRMSDGEHPITLAADEGFIVANENNFGTASGIILHLELAWAEVTLF
jgi:hypothetical protein